MKEKEIPKEALIDFAEHIPLTQPLRRFWVEFMTRRFYNFMRNRFSLSPEEARTVATLVLGFPVEDFRPITTSPELLKQLNIGLYKLTGTVVFSLPHGLKSKGK